MGALGAGLSLAVASSVVLLVVSSVVAFNGWPDDLKGSREPEAASLAQASAAPARRSGRSDVARVDLPPPPPARSGGVRGEAASGRERATGNGPARQIATEGTVSTTVTVTPRPRTTAAGPPPEPRAPELRSTAEPVSDLVRGTTKAVGETLAPVAPAVGGVLESVGAAGAETLDQVGQTVDGAVQQLLQ